LGYRVAVIGVRQGSAGAVPGSARLHRQRSGRSGPDAASHGRCQGHHRHRHKSGHVGWHSDENILLGVAPLLPANNRPFRSADRKCRDDFTRGSYPKHSGKHMLAASLTLGDPEQSFVSE